MQKIGLAEITCQENNCEDIEKLSLMEKCHLCLQFLADPKEWTTKSTGKLTMQSSLRGQI